MKACWVIAVAVLQLGVLAYMAAEREWVWRTGRTVFLRTLPVDPRDPMRGDYVRFNYEIGDVPRALCRDGVVAWLDGAATSGRSLVDRRVYAAVKLDGAGVAEIVSLSDRRPADGTVIRGRVESVNRDRVRVRYGVEALFLQQGSGRVLEAEQRSRPGLAFKMELAVGESGLAVIKGHRWEWLGLTFQRETVKEPAAGKSVARRETLRGLNLEWKNWGDRPLAIVTGTGAGSRLRLVSGGQGFQEGRFRWVGENRAAEPVQAKDVRVLQPGESFREFLDLEAAAWFVVDREKPGSAPAPMRTVEESWTASFRVEYRPPSVQESAGLPEDEKLSRSRVRSATFNP